mmetsp:Transcript_31470/g.53093  ORF Transcript_31470/g.53093 Transcript_31470/m.53093 type:complete len:82 (+) Transcript_31470:65-310(+)|eukprot:CAMPEP_0174963888 /NCGR_PEP_ID=MMETSP0004_2-20121128/5575_1 /TAXON_ID=420556 /ORGANISM="Ochromonas sp., Strain CCMP1393" /LENGTH=81 /DNA_ID=CAMNT_0016212553 /DNA_START=87 /DNA_END=332 /DNA_ORIENTATION=+
MEEDSSLPASELRKRYHRGGTVADDELTSAQLRARHAIPANSKDFSEGGESKPPNAIPVILLCVIMLIMIAIIYMYVSSEL